MDIAALIFAPLILALIYSWPKINMLPSLVRVGGPVALMAILFIAFMGYIPAVQDAITTKTPLIRAVENMPFLTFHVDGLALLFALLITGIGTVIALYAGMVFEDSDVYRRFVRGLLALVGAMPGLVLTDYAQTLPLFWVLTTVFAAIFIDFGRQDETQTSGRRSRLWELVGSSRLFILFAGMAVLTEQGAAAKGMNQSLVEISQISAANLSYSSIYYNISLGIILTWLLLEIIFTGLQWRAAKHMSVEAHVVISVATLLSSPYFLLRFYPALHDNPLWWTAVTGIGLLIMLLGALWALRQNDLKAILVYRSMSAFGACVALLGLPEFLGVKVALIGIMVHALSQAALFLTLDINLKRPRLIIVGLALLPITIFHVFMIGAFYQVMLTWSGISLAVVVVSTALLVISAIRIMRDALFQTGSVGAQRAAPLLLIAPGILAFSSLLSIALFDPVIAPLLYPSITAQRLAGDTMTPLILGIIAIMGGAILYATRATWGHWIRGTPLVTLDNLPEQ